MIRVMILLLCSFGMTIANKKAVFIEPFTDLGISAVCTDTFFDSVAPSKTVRAHQALFNEACTVLEEKGNAVRIVLPNLVYKEKSKNEPSDFWAPRAALLFFDDVPTTIKIEQLFPTYGARDCSTLVLTMPIYDKVTKKNYSAGTRFVRTYKDTTRFYGIVLYDATNKKKVNSRVAKSHACIENIVCLEDAQKEFVQLLYTWVSMSEVIPYVWGGSSFIYTQKDGDFFVDKNSRIRYKNNLPAVGYDCSELILRATQICGLPYFCKITNVIPDHLRQLLPGEELAAGDILLHKGHVMVVGAVERNELIESRGYATGYGKVHAIALNKLFPEIRNYDDLKESYFSKKPIKVVRKDGSFSRYITDLKIFKLSSAWEK